MPTDPRCWSCLHLLEAATNIFGPNQGPTDGDATVCIYCGAIGVFTGHGIDQRQPTEVERQRFMADERLVAVLGAVLTRLATEGAPDAD